MNDAIERRYHRLLMAYPARYRAERGEEIVATLLEAAPPGRRWPTAREAVDLLGSGLVARLGFGHVPALAAGAAIAAPVALAAAGGLGAFEWVPAVGLPPYYSQPPDVLEPGGLARLVWPVVALAAAAAPRVGRVLIAGGLVLTGWVASTYVAAGLYGSLGALAMLAVFGLIAAIGWPRPAGPAHRLTVALGVPVVLAATMLVGIRLPVDPVYGWSPQPLRVPFGWLPGEPFHPLAPTGTGFVLLAGVVLIAVARWREPRWIWAAVLLAVPAGGLARMLVELLHAETTTPRPTYAELLVSVPAFAGGALAAIWLAGQTRSRRASEAKPSAERGLAIVATAALAGAAGLSAGWWLIELRILRGRDPTFPYGIYEPIPVAGRIAFAAWSVAAVGFAVAGPRVGRWLTWVALASTVAAALADDAMARGSEVPPLIILATLALLAMPGRATRAQRLGVIMAAVGLAAVAVVIVVAQDDDSDRYAQLAAWIAALASIPYAIAAAAAAVAVRAGGGRRLAAAGVLVVSTVALSAVLLSFTAHLMAVVLASAAALVGLGAAVVRWFNRTARTPRAG
jgi:hypothetical protein